MAKSAHQKLKLLYLKQILEQETDDDHGLTTAQLIERLAALDINAERKAIYRDLDQLREFGLDIIKRPGTNGAHTEYALGARDFEFPELMLMVDAVQSSRFLTKRKSDALVDQIKSLASRHQASVLSKRVYVENRIKMQNESIYYSVDAIDRAIKLHRKVEFHYFSYDLDKQKVLRHNSKLYVVTPVVLTYTRDYYYLKAYDEDAREIHTYRVDRMQNPCVSEQKAIRNDEIANYDAGAFESQAFDMYSGEPVAVKLRVGPDSMNWVIDRFGADVETFRVDQDHACVHVTVLKSDTFFGWLAEFGTSVHIESPKWLAEEYRAYLQGIVDAY